MKRCVKCFGECEDVFEVCPSCGSSMGCPAADGKHLSPGTVLKQRYFIGFAAGNGGFGMIYRAFDTILQRVVAVKEYYPDFLAGRSADGKTVTAPEACRETEFAYRKKQFIKEAQLLSGFAGARAFPKIYDSFEENGTAYYVMEYLEGRTLAEEECVSPLDPELVVYAVAEAAAAVSLLHRKGLVHRDIAPDNLFVCAGEHIPRIVLLDFGATERVGERKPHPDTVLKNGYSAPELYEGKRADKTADVYALGGTLYAMLRGEKPPRGDERAPGSVLLSDREADSVPEKLVRIVNKATAADPKNRYADAVEFLHALGKASAVAKDVEKRTKEAPPEAGKRKAAERSVEDLTERRGITEAVPSRLLPGTVLKDRYTVGLEAEKCGVLYRYSGFDRVLRAPVHICEFFPDGVCERGPDGLKVEKKGPDGAFSDRLALYRNTVAALTGEDTDSCFESFSDIFEENGTVCLVTPATGDIPLAETERFLRKKKYSGREVRFLLSPIAAELAGGKVHGNIRPETVLLGTRRLTLRDCAQLCYPAFCGETGMPESAYSAPETKDNPASDSTAADCYALGALAYRLLTGREPMKAAERQALTVSTGKDPLLPVREAVRVKKDLAEGIDAALRLQPAGREKLLEVLLR